MKDLRQILSSAYSQEDWISFLKKLFAHSSGTGAILQKPQRIDLPKSEKVKEAYELGNYETTEGRLIGIYQVNISEDMLLYRNKVGLRQLMKNIYKYNVDGVLVVFVQEKKWRLSFISEIIKEVDEKGKIIKEITNEKRFTYLLGEGEKTKTATDRLQLLVGKELSLEDFKNAFAVEALNNDFFDRYKDIYEGFVQHITGVRYEKKGNKYQENKKHQPHPNFDGYKDYKGFSTTLHPDSETKPFKNKEFQNLFGGNEKAVRDFVKRMMGRIVFLYFIQKKGWLAVPKGKNWGEGNYDYLYQLYKETPKEDQSYFYEKYLVPLFFECFTDKKSESETNDLRFPYLNGGLFDKTQDQHFDKVNLPYSIFTELFDTFNSYNFTVYEDAPNEHTVAVDPEMLGHIFENLLEDNKDKGAFYTPKEIVHYMCKESLKTFLLSKIVIDDNQSEKVKDVITKIIEHQPLNEEERNYVKEKGNVITTSLENVKICDPAIGSGAFPMGLLQEIYYIKITLHQLGITPEQTDAQIKKHIIEKNIYGVDIDAGAVDIARLRFWLSLIVDQQLPQPLPNLDFKIMQGNSLLESYQGVDLSALDKGDIIKNPNDKDSIDYGEEFITSQQKPLFDKTDKELIQQLITDYFSLTEDKNLKRKEINELIEKGIHSIFHREKREVNKNINAFFIKFGITSEEDLAEKLQKGTLTSKGTEYKAYIASKKRLLELDYIENELISFQTKIERPYFLWRTYFGDVIKGANNLDNSGFDIVIGNPPYFVYEATRFGEIEELRKQEDLTIAFDGKLNAYKLFLASALKCLVRKNGIVCYIFQNSFLADKQAKSLREYTLKKTQILTIDSFPERDNKKKRVFESVKMSVCIVLIKNAIENKSFIIHTWEDKNKSKGVTTSFTAEEIRMLDRELLSIPRIKQENLPILVKVQLNTKKVGLYCFEGELNMTIHKRYFTKNINNPLILKGASVQRYFWTIETSQGEIDYLDKKSYSKDFNKSNKSKHFCYERIALQGMTGANDEIRIIATIVPKNIFLANSCNYILPIKGANNMYILGVLNSKLINWYFRCFSTNSNVNGYEINNLPISLVNEKLQQPIITLVEQILKLKNENSKINTTSLENQIDILVYKLYNLTYEEIKIIDPNIKSIISKEEYEAKK